MPVITKLENDWEFLGEQCGIELYHNLLTGEYREIDIIELMQSEHVNDSVIMSAGSPVAVMIFGNPNEWGEDFKYYKERNA